MASKYHKLSWSEKMSDKDDLMYMRRAIDLARQGEHSGIGPIGCVIVLDGVDIHLDQMNVNAIWQGAVYAAI